MAFSDVLSDKLAELRQAAVDAYGDYLREIPNTDITLSDNQTTVEADHLPPDVVADYQAEFERFVSEELDPLVERFAKYYPLDLGEISDTSARLSRNDVSALSAHWGADPYSGEQPRKVVDRIYYAADLVFQISEPARQRSEGFWRGDAADSFNDNFLDPFKDFAGRQIFCGIYLANVVRVFRNAIRRTQNDLKAIADACTARLRDDGAVSLSESLSATSLMADLIAFVVPSPFDDIADVSSIVLGQAASRVGDDEEPPEWQIGGIRPWDVIASTMEVLASLEERLAEEDEELCGYLDQDLDEFFHSPDFQTQPEAPNPPDRAAGEFAEVDVPTVYEYGAYYLPTAAAQFDEAKLLLKECTVPDWFNELIYPRSRGRFVDARTALRIDLYRTCDCLIDAGEALVDICNGYDFTEAENQAAFEDIKESLPPPPRADYPYELPPTPRPPRELPD